MFVAEQYLAQAWAMKDAGETTEVIERACGGEEVKAQKARDFHAGTFDGKPCTRCNGVVDRSGVSGKADTAGECAGVSEVPERVTARSKKMATREGIPVAVAEMESAR